MRTPNLFLVGGAKGSIAMYNIEEQNLDYKEYKVKYEYNYLKECKCRSQKINNKLSTIIIKQYCIMLLRLDG